MLSLLDTNQNILLILLSDLILFEANFMPIILDIFLNQFSLYKFKA